MNYPIVDWELCNQGPEKKRMLGGLCQYHGLMGAWGKCLAPQRSRANANCLAIKKYQTDLKKLKSDLKKLESRKG